MQNITSIIASHIVTLYGDIRFSPTLSAPPKPEHGEYCFGVFTLAKPLGKSPNILAEEIATELRSDATHFTQVNVIGGYVNFSCTAIIWIDILSQIQNPPTPLRYNSPPEVRTRNLGQGGTTSQTIVVDYIGANAGKPLHIGHLCTPSIGQAICNIHNYLGYQVIGDSHFGDWGGIFGKIIYGLKKSYISSGGLLLNLSNEFKKEHILKFGGINFILEIYQSVHREIENDRDIYNNLLEKYIRQIEEDKWPKKFQNGGFKGAIDCKDIESFLELENTVKTERFTAFKGINEQFGIFQNIEEFTRNEFKKITQGDKENIELWEIITSISITEIEKKLDLLNVHAMYNIGESFYEGLSLPRPNNEDYPDLKWNMKDIVEELVKNKVATQNEDGSVGVVFPEETKLPSCILQKKDGTGLYLTSDLAAIKYRLTNGWNPSKIIYSVDVRQQLHLRQAFAIAKMAWPELTEGVEFFHAFNGFIKLKEGAMSTRHGTVIFLEKLIEEGEKRISRVLEEKGRSGENSLKKEDIESITVGAIKYSYLSQDREKDVTFDWDKALSFEGNSGPYIQYACVRAAKVFGQSNPSCQTIKLSNYQTASLSPYDTALIRTLAEMEQKIQATADTYKPHTLALYCYDLAVCFNSFYVHTPKILEETDQNLRNLRLTLCKLTSEKLTLGFDLLGIKMPSEM